MTTDPDPLPPSEPLRSIVCEIEKHRRLEESSARRREYGKAAFHHGMYAGLEWAREHFAPYSAEIARLRSRVAELEEERRQEREEESRAWAALTGHHWMEGREPGSLLRAAENAARRIAELEAENRNLGRWKCQSCGCRFDTVPPMSEESLALALQNSKNCSKCVEASLLAARVAGLASENQELRSACASVFALISESRGVAGLHLNGNEAPWDSLTVGEFSSWLEALEAVRGLVEKPPEESTT